MGINPEHLPIFSAILRKPGEMMRAIANSPWFSCRSKYCCNKYIKTACVRKNASYYWCASILILPCARSHTRPDGPFSVRVDRQGLTSIGFAAWLSSIPDNGRRPLSSFPVATSDETKERIHAFAQLFRQFPPPCVHLSTRNLFNRHKGGGQKNTSETRE